MKKITLIWLFIFAIILSGCTNKKVETIETNNCNGDQNECIDINFSTYEWELVVQWVWPEISFEPTVEEWILVLRWNFEDHADHVFLRPWIWEDFFKSENEYLPGNTVKLVWKVQFADWAAGNHYYVVDKVNKLELIKYPDTDDIKDILESYSYCETDDDCTYTMWECPFGCYVPFNKKFGEMPVKIMDNYFEINGKTCVYSCMYMNTVKCDNYKCVMNNEELENLID